MSLLGVVVVGCALVAPYQSPARRRPARSAERRRPAPGQPGGIGPHRAVLQAADAQPAGGPVHDASWLPAVRSPGGYKPAAGHTGEITGWGPDQSRELASWVRSRWRQRRRCGGGTRRSGAEEHKATLPRGSPWRRTKPPGASCGGAGGAEGSRRRAACPLAAAPAVPARLHGDAPRFSKVPRAASRWAWRRPAPRPCSSLIAARCSPLNGRRVCRWWSSAPELLWATGPGEQAVAGGHPGLQPRGGGAVANASMPRSHPSAPLRRLA
jgi:hypothetical protein